MYRKVSVESVPLTPELASQFAGMTPLPGERCLRSARRAYLEAQLLRGKFSGPDWADGRCLATGATYRLDGQHSSDLLASLPLGAEFPTGLLVTITHYEFDSMADAADVFNLFNNPRSVRNNHDMIGMYSAQEQTLAQYSREFLVDVGNGIYEYERRRGQAKAKNAVKLGARERGLYFMYPNRPEFLEFTHWLSGFRGKSNTHFMHRAFIVADMIEHHVSDQSAADVFWPLVFSEGHPEQDHETRLLAKWFGQQLAIAKQPKLDADEFRKKTKRAWKLFKAGETDKAA